MKLILTMLIVGLLLLFLLTPFFTDREVMGLIGVGAKPTPARFLVPTKEAPVIMKSEHYRIER
ncbi:MAG: hypothetical protein M1150_03935 [Patescibacteria group bacterium]|nr:hypothetical protein [Patescibacteria group bacterium]